MRLKILFLAILAVGCMPDSKEEEGSITSPNFDLAGFSQELLKKQVEANTEVIKTTFVDEKQETKNVSSADSAFWATELSSLIGTNLSNPIYNDAYSISKGLTDNNSNLLVTKYSASPETTINLKHLEIKYLENPSEVRQLIALFVTNNAVYSTEQSVKLWLNNYGNKLLIDSMVIDGYNKTIFIDTMFYQSKVVQAN